MLIRSVARREEKSTKKGGVEAHNRKKALIETQMDAESLVTTSRLDYVWKLAEELDKNGRASWSLLFIIIFTYYTHKRYKVV